MERRVFAVPVFDKWLVHAPLDGVAALVNRAALREFPQELAAALAGDPEPEPQPRTGAIEPQFLGLVPTRACNLRCAYCGFGATAQGERMDPRMAAAGVDWMADFALRNGRETLDVHFFGGEPLSAPETVEVAVHRTRVAGAQRGLVPVLEIATNGVHGEARASWVGDYFDSVVLSFDGFQTVQDRHRPAPDGRGSFDRVAQTARVLSASPAALCLRVCAAGDNVEQLAETTAWFVEEFRPASIDFETLQPTPESEQAGLRPPDPWAFASQFRKARSIARRNGVEPVYAAAATGKPRLSFCPVGNDTLILHPDGRVTACYLQERDWQRRQMDLTLGRLGADGRMDLREEDVERVRAVPAARPRCADCFCRWSCAGGCHVNHSFPGCSSGYDDFCIQTRVITACSLLDGLDQQAMADLLAADRQAMERLALRPSDRLEDFERP